MVVSEIELYEILSVKIGKPEAKALTEFVEAKAEKQLVDKLSAFATREDLFATKEELTKEITGVREDLTKEIASVRIEMREMEVRLNRNAYIVGVVQFLAIVGSVLMLLKFHVA